MKYEFTGLSSVNTPPASLELLGFFRFTFEWPTPCREGAHDTSQLLVLTQAPCLRDKVVQSYFT